MFCAGVHTPESRRSFKLHLTICDLQGLSSSSSEEEELVNKESANMIVQIEWVGPRKAYLPRGAILRNCTSKQSTHPGGSVTWNEGFYHHCKLKPRDSKSFRSWMINLQILVSITHLDRQYHLKPFFFFYDGKLYSSKLTKAVG